jgi:nicotinate-nucleotide adenylyltransferase
MGIYGHRDRGPGAGGPDDRKAIGVFGGTFDPVHNGHLRIALDAREALGLAEVRLIPLAQAVHREQPETPVALRLKMLQAAIAGRPGLVADDRELRRQGPSYSIDTLKSLRRDMPDSSLCLLLGDDAFSGFADWRDPHGILTIANIAVLQRPGQPLPRVSTLKQILSRHRVTRLDWNQTGQILFCPVTQLDIASSDIRRRVASGRSIDFLVPAPVLDLIGRHGLYR